MSAHQKAAMGRRIQLKNKQIILKSYPKGWVEPSHMELKEYELNTELQLGDVLLKILFISLDPYIRMRMNEDGGGEDFYPSFKPGQPLEGHVVAEVYESENSDIKKGDHVAAFVSWQLYVLVPGGKNLEKVDSELAPLSYYLGILGMPGLTAYFGFFDVCRPQPLDAVYVSAASGAVGQIVGQLAKLEGCRVVGSSGSNEKIKVLKETLGYDEAFNYKEEDTRSAIKKYLPKGIDIYFENVGGKTLDAVLENVRQKARIAACGMVSQYNLEKPEPVYNLLNIVTHEVKMQGFLALSYETRKHEFYEKMSALLKEKKIKYLEDMTEGLEKVPEAFVRMLRGDKIGKAVVKIA